MAHAAPPGTGSFHANPQRQPTFSPPPPPPLPASNAGGLGGSLGGPGREDDSLALRQVRLLEKLNNSVNANTMAVTSLAARVDCLESQLAELQRSQQRLGDIIREVQQSVEPSPPERTGMKRKCMEDPKPNAQRFANASLLERQMMVYQAVTNMDQNARVMKEAISTAKEMTKDERDAMRKLMQRIIRSRLLSHPQHLEPENIYRRLLAKGLLAPPAQRTLESGSVVKTEICKIRREVKSKLKTSAMKLLPTEQHLSPIEYAKNLYGVTLYNRSTLKAQHAMRVSATKWRLVVRKHLRAGQEGAGSEGVNAANGTGEEGKRPGSNTAGFSDDDESQWWTTTWRILMEMFPEPSNSLEAHEQLHLEFKMNNPGLDYTSEGYDDEEDIEEDVPDMSENYRWV